MQHCRIMILPSDDETRLLMEHAWQEFQQQAGSHLAAESMKTTNE